MRAREQFQPRDRFGSLKAWERVREQGAARVGPRKRKGSLKRWAAEMRRTSKARARRLAEARAAGLVR